MTVSEALKQWRDIIQRGNSAILTEEIPEEELPDDIRESVMNLRKQLDDMGVDRSTLVLMSIDYKNENPFVCEATISYEIYNGKIN